MDTSEWCRVLRVLWSEEGAGWAQAIFTVAAVAFAYAQGSKQYRKEHAEQARQRKIRRRALTLQLMAPITNWKRDVANFALKSREDMLAQAAYSGLHLPLRPPKEVLEALPAISEYFGTAGRQIEEAIYLYQLLLQGRTTMRVACKGQIVIAETSAKIIERNLEYVWDAVGALEAAERALHIEFREAKG